MLYASKKLNGDNDLKGNNIYFLILSSMQSFENTSMENTYSLVDIVHNTLDNTKIKEKIYKDAEGFSYKILNYNETTEENDFKNAQFRSVIVSHPENELLAFSPPRALTEAQFVTNNPMISGDLLINEIVEGTMINVFYDKRKDVWELATKSAVGGNYWYFRNNYNSLPSQQPKQKSFKTMFLEAMDVDSLEDIPFLLKHYSYSFVLQHPDNHIVFSITEPRVYLIAVYNIFNGCSAVYLPPSNFNFAMYNVYIPQVFLESNYDDIKKKYCSEMSAFNSVNMQGIMGVMVTNKRTGQRIAFRNERYEGMKLIRGNNPNLLYQYLCLVYANRIVDFLGYFPQYRKMFQQFCTRYTQFITTLHNAYVSYYVKKEGIQIDKKYFMHVYKLHHEIYLPSLQMQNKIIITRDVVSKYVREMSPNQLYYHLARGHEYPFDANMLQADIINTQRA